MYCASCGQKNLETDKYCQKCGQELVLKAISNNSSSTNKLASRENKHSYLSTDLFRGRLSRKQWAITFLLLLVVWFAVGFLVGLLIALVSEDTAFLLGVPLYVFYAIIGVLSWATHVRRLHDLGYTGWLSLLFLIPIINIVLILALAIAPGKEEKNKYGNRPTSDVGLLGLLFGRTA